MTGYLANSSGPVPLVLDLRIPYNRFGSNSNPSINGHLHYPNDVDRSLNVTVTDKIRQYHTDYNNRPSNVISIMTNIDSMSGRLHSEFVCLLFLQTHRETDRFFASSGVQLVKSTSYQFHYRRTTFSSQLKSKIGDILVKTVVLGIKLNDNGVPLVSGSHNHPSYSQTSRLLFSSLF